MQNIQLTSPIDIENRQRLNKFDNIGNNSRLMFLRNARGILSGLVAFVESWILMSLETSISEIEKSQSFCVKKVEVR